MSIDTTRRIVACLLALVTQLPSAAAAGQPQPPVAEEEEFGFECKPRPDGVSWPIAGFSIYDENDSFPFAGGDKDYTQALRVSVSYHRRALPCWAQRTTQWRLPGAGTDGFTANLALVLGQGMYTPDVLTTRLLDPNDRGFSDFNYVGAELSLISIRRNPGTTSQEGGNIRYTFEGLVGALGAADLANATQGGLHALKLGNMPKGWNTTSPSAIGVYTRYKLERRFDFRPKTPLLPDADLTLGPGFEIGNVRNSVAAHAAVRVGVNLTGFPAAPIGAGLSSTELPALEFGALAGWESRAVFTTNLVRGTPDSDGFSARTGVHDLRYGVFARWKALQAAYLLVQRSGEFEIDGDASTHRFGSMQVTYTPFGDSSEGVSKWFLRDIAGELGMGRNFSGPELGTGDPVGVTAQLAARKGIAKGFDVGVESIVVSVESTPTPGEPGNRSDLILRQQLATLGWTTELPFGRVGIRAGSCVGGQSPGRDHLPPACRRPPEGSLRGPGLPRAEGRVDDGRAVLPARGAPPGRGLRRELPPHEGGRGHARLAAAELRQSHRLAAAADSIACV